MDVNRKSSKQTGGGESEGLDVPTREWIPTSTRLHPSMRAALEKAQLELGDEKISITMRRAIAEFLDRHFRKRKRAYRKP
jgi:hypothetical protein